MRALAIGVAVAVCLVVAIAIAASGAIAQDAGTRSLASSQVSVTNTATQAAQARAGRNALTIQNHGATAMYCGPTNAVTTTTGFRLPGVDGASITLPTTAAVWCITAAGSQTVSVIEAF